MLIISSLTDDVCFKTLCDDYKIFQTVTNIIISFGEKSPQNAHLIIFGLIAKYSHEFNNWFTWEDIPGDENIKVINFLENYLKIEWVKNAIIQKKSDNREIIISNSETFLSLKLNREKNGVTLETGSGKNLDFIAKEEGGKLTIYKISDYATLKNILYNYKNDYQKTLKMKTAYKYIYKLEEKQWIKQERIPIKRILGTPAKGRLRLSKGRRGFFWSLTPAGFEQIFKWTKPVIQGLSFPDID